MSNKCTSTDKTTCSNGFFCPAHVPEEETACTSCTGNTTEKCQCGTVLNCAVCDSSDSSECGTCLDGYHLTDLGDCSECQQYQFMTEAGCQDCDRTCSSCQSDGKKCLYCANSHIPTIQQTCYRECDANLPPGFACEDGSQKSCGAKTQITGCKCAGKSNCFTCNSDNTQCETCLKGYKLVNGDCSDCVQGAEMIGEFCIGGVQEDLNSSLSGGAVAGIVIAIIVIIGGIGGGVFWYIKKSKTQLKNVGQGEVMQE
ncbi:Cysteine-rich membrane protein 2 [Spironucleus salmonicida]|uniref:Cysteine-rich membrane protein 2 n=1 Tax=Spironucleus salmonicida TaxID=348837 RepID=V6LDU7_9EUKA|nr:Cysteine-rich membrane protein 2 [Spironucleus salmonicida]|eukprot:EST42448.1 Cysteine-rich membrane protein 2 [Spironucleus salmonicida]